MTNGRVDVVTSVERRRRWSAAEKQRLVASTPDPGACVSAVAREARVHPNQLWGWRRQMQAAAPVHFTPVRVAEEEPSIVAAHARMSALGRSRSGCPGRGCGSPERQIARRTRPCWPRWQHAGADDPDLPRRAGARKAKVS
ncbi:transposase, partial [Bradyrhizobium sp.]|uniref:transposase n=1 Tax=Bradyrhizobium sp. TaxID=376 RepID=UPI003C6B6422